MQIGTLAKPLGEVGHTRVADWLDLLTPWFVIGFAALTLVRAAILTARRRPDRASWLLLGSGAIAFAEGTGLHLAANSIHNVGPSGHVEDVTYLGDEQVSSGATVVALRSAAPGRSYVVASFGLALVPFLGWGCPLAGCRRRPVPGVQRAGVDLSPGGRPCRRGQARKQAASDTVSLGSSGRAVRRVGGGMRRTAVVSGQAASLRGMRGRARGAVLAACMLAGTALLAGCGGGGEEDFVPEASLTATYDGDAVPAAVTATAEEIYRAAADGDLAALAELAAEVPDFTYTFGDGEASAEGMQTYWESEAVNGTDVPGVLVGLLSQRPARTEVEGYAEYVWPSAFATQRPENPANPEDPEDPEVTACAECIAWTPRLGISADGDWVWFVLGGD